VNATEPVEAGSLEPQFAEGDEIAGARIESCVHALADTEIYRAKLPDGRTVAVKYVKEDAPEYVRTALRNEVTLLSRLAKLAPGLAPEPITQHLDGRMPYLIMEWCEGRTVHDIAKDMRADLDTRARFAADLVRAYGRLHNAGVLHGDVHPLNALATSGMARLVDFGGAHVMDLELMVPRLGLLQHYEPEIVECALRGDALPPVTALGEQHNVAAMAYLLLTRTPPLRLGFERDEALRQIREQPARRFREMGLVWPEVERVLARAMAKDPNARYATYGEFESDLIGAIENSRPGTAERRTAAKAPRDPADGAQFLREQYGLYSALLRDGLSRGPTASLYHGAAGIAYALLRTACLTADAELLAAADLWVTRAIRDAGTGLAFLGPEIGLMPGMTRDDSVFHNLPGLHVVAALIYYAAGRSTRAAGSIRAFLAAALKCEAGDGASGARGPIDATNGPASHLLAAALLRPICEALDKALLEELRSFAASAATFVEDRITVPSDGKCLLGFAHGRAGNIYALLRWAAADGAAPAARTQAHLDYLAARGMRDGNRISWPIELGNPMSATWSGWCHGTAGHVLLWLAAAKVFARDEYVEIAKAAGHHVVAASGESGTTLCCGTAGEALSLFALGRFTGDEEWFARGRELMHGTNGGRHEDANPHGLFRGAVGWWLAAEESRNPERSSWPVCESPLDV
jgi:serine/threonine-protein kinase